ncbi:hypothetical protein Pfo_014273, partial [Paulownia fortunei]
TLSLSGINSDEGLSLSLSLSLSLFFVSLFSVSVTSFIIHTLIHVHSDPKYQTVNLSGFNSSKGWL